MNGNAAYSYDLTSPGSSFNRKDPSTVFAKKRQVEAKSTQPAFPCLYLCLLYSLRVFASSLRTLRLRDVLRARAEQKGEYNDDK